MEELPSSSSSSSSSDSIVNEVAESSAAVEHLLVYSFKDPKLLVEALTRANYTEAAFLPPRLPFSSASDSFPLIESKSKRANKKMEELPSSSSSPSSSDSIVDEVAESSAAVEHLLGYSFKDPKLLVEALTHANYTEGKSNQRLQFLGDAVLGLAITIHIFFAYPQLNSGQLTKLRSANVGNKKFARVAVRHNLYSHLLRRNTPDIVLLDQKVQEFTEAVQNDADELLYRSEVGARKVLADIVESIAAAVYLDCGSDMEELWRVFQPLLEPIVRMETLQEHPVSMLNDCCQKLGKKPKFEVHKEGMMKIVNVYVEGKMWGSGRSEHQEIAKLKAAKAAVEQPETELLKKELEVQVTEEGAKQRLKEFCDKKLCSEPIYTLEEEEEEEEPDKKNLFTYSVQLCKYILKVLDMISMVIRNHRRKLQRTRLHWHH